ARADCVGVEGRITHPSRYRRRGTRRRAAGNGGGVPRINYWTKMTDETCRPHAQLVHVHFADDNSPGLFEFRNGHGIDFRNPILESLERRRCFDICGVVEIFDADRNAVKWTAPLAGSDFAFRSSR